MSRWNAPLGEQKSMRKSLLTCAAWSGCRTRYQVQLVRVVTKSWHEQVIVAVSRPHFFFRHFWCHQNRWVTEMVTSTAKVISTTTGCKNYTICVNERAFTLICSPNISAWSLPWLHHRYKSYEKFSEFKNIPDRSFTGQCPNRRCLCWKIWHYETFFHRSYPADATRDILIKPRRRLKHFVMSIVRLTSQEEMSWLKMLKMKIILSYHSLDWHPNLLCFGWMILLH